MEIRDTLPATITTISEVNPLDLQYGVKDKLEVPPKLEEYFNCQDSNQYVLIDASSIDQFPTLIEMADTQYEILLGQSIQKQFRRVATYLIDVTDSKSLLTWLFTHSTERKLDWCLAQSKAGVFFQSQLGIKELARYFRKFTRIRDGEEKWRYFRFADPYFFQYMMNSMLNAPEYLYRWFYIDNKLLITNYAIYDFQKSSFTVFRATDELAKYKNQLKPFIYDEYFEEMTNGFLAQRFVNKIINILEKDYHQFYKTQLSDLGKFITSANYTAIGFSLKSELARGQFVLASILMGRILSRDDLKAVGFFSQSHSHENRKTKILLNQVILNIQRRNLINGD